jgi:Flp pilus assembly protein TadD
LSIKKYQFPIVCLFLAIITLLCYWPATHDAFVILDDNHYISDNPHVTTGLSWSNAAWAFTTDYFCNWHPLTWISFMIDFQFYGANAGGFHLTNVILHVANTLLLFLLLQAMTGRFWPSAMVAALFAWHPLHVESVAWVSERKDVLSAFFWITTIMIYVKYVEVCRAIKDETRSESQVASKRIRIFFYLLTLLSFVLGLMSKPMLVTLPCVLLLLDYWPLKRTSIALEFSSSSKLVVEKVPFFALALGASVVTYIVQKAGGAVAPLETNPLGDRVANALISYVRYIGKTFWPVDLSVRYAYPSHWPLGLVAGAAGLLMVLTLFFVVRAARQPFLLVGWLWFVGTLVPVIGLVQVGAQSMADRYTYIPSIGLFVLLVWGLDELAASWKFKQAVLAGTGAAVLAACLLCTHLQLRCWQDSETLFRQALTSDPDNYLAMDGLGKALEDKGRTEEALASYSKAVSLQPNFSDGQYNLGTLLMVLGRMEEAVEHLKAAIAINPRSAEAHNNLGRAFINLGKLDEAAVQLARVLELKPKDPAAYNYLASVRLMQSRLDEAMVLLDKALELDPGFAEARRNLGVALIQKGNTNGALAQFSRAVQLMPGNAELHFNLGLALFDENQAAAAATQFNEAVRLNARDSRFHYRLARALARLKEFSDAISEYRVTLRLSPDFPEALNDLAWLLACAPDNELRSGLDAVNLSEKACALTRYTEPNMLLTLAAAYAEAGRFSDAVETAKKSRDLAHTIGEQVTEQKAQDSLKLFEVGRPCREEP